MSAHVATRRPAWWPSPVKLRRRGGWRADVAIVLGLYLLALEAVKRTPPAWRRWVRFYVLLVPLTLALLVVDYWRVFLAAVLVYAIVRVTIASRRRRRDDDEANAALGDTSAPAIEREGAHAWRRPPADAAPDDDDGSFGWWMGQQ